MASALLRQCGPGVIRCIIAFVVAFAGCHHPFDPRGPLESKLVIFSVLSTDRTSQVVRVEHTYMPIGFDASTYTSDNFVPGALVTLREGTTTVALRDTVFPRPDTSRYAFPIRAYYTRPYEIKYGGSYRLTVQSPQFGTSSASILVPARPALTIAPSSIAVIQSPDSHERTDEIVFTIDLGSGAKGWIGRMYVYYDVLGPDGWREERAAVPVYAIFPKVFTSIVFAEMSLAGYKNRSACVYLNDFYKKVLLNVAYERYPTSKLTFTRVIFEVVQVTESLYNYYEVAHAGSDPLSVRLDEPLYTNLTGGVGVMGAYTVDSLIQPIPDIFSFNRR